MNVIHRDVKAANILLNEEGIVKIADFGVSEQLSSSVDSSRQMIGTPLWMAPEVIQKKKYDSNADVWSLGITIIEMAEGKPPHYGENALLAMRNVPTRPPPTLEHPSRFSSELNDFIAKCLIKNPAERPSAVDLLSHPFLEKAKPNALNPLIATCLHLKQQRKALAAGDVMPPRKLLAATLQKPRVVPKLERTSSRSMVVSSSSSGPKVVSETSKGSLFAPPSRARTLSEEKVFDGIIIDDSTFEFNEEDAPINFPQPNVSKSTSEDRSTASLLLLLNEVKQDIRSDILSFTSRHNIGNSDAESLIKTIFGRLSILEPEDNCLYLSYSRTASPSSSSSTLTGTPRKPPARPPPIPPSRTLTPGKGLSSLQTINTAMPRLNIPSSGIDSWVDETPRVNPDIPETARLSPLGLVQSASEASEAPETPRVYLDYEDSSKSSEEKDDDKDDINTHELDSKSVSAYDVTPTVSPSSTPPTTLRSESERFDDTTPPASPLSSSRSNEEDFISNAKGLPPLPVSLVLGTGGVDVKIQWLMRAVHILAESNAKLETRIANIEGVPSSPSPQPAAERPATTTPATAAATATATTEPTQQPQQQQQASD
eukprot:TRINITY_DN3179_c0_g1_i1.p1 TRINITY_DN3179_c0_g1~~TRINITY_DN3179_c0_g1_i1.p1  ORF type:complete len:599 (-),score=178.19 TRINITY_DN3179_c0_g1_i1:66-1862(-)